MLENFRKLWYFEHIHGLSDYYIAIHWKVWIPRLSIPYFSFSWVHVGFIIYRLHVRFGVQMMGQVFAETCLKPVILIIKPIASLRNMYTYVNVWILTLFEYFLSFCCSSTTWTLVGPFCQEYFQSFAKSSKLPRIASLLLQPNCFRQPLRSMSPQLI